MLSYLAFFLFPGSLRPLSQKKCCVIFQVLELYDSMSAKVLASSLSPPGCTWSLICDLFSRGFWLQKNIKRGRPPLEAITLWLTVTKIVCYAKTNSLAERLVDSLKPVGKLIAFDDTIKQIRDRILYQCFFTDCTI